MKQPDNGGAEGPQGPGQAVLGDSTNSTNNNNINVTIVTPTKDDLTVWANTKPTRTHQRQHPTLLATLEEAADLVQLGVEDVKAPPTDNGEPPMSMLHPGQNIAAKKWNEMNQTTRINKIADQIAEMWEKRHPKGIVINGKHDEASAKMIFAVCIDGQRNNNPPMEPRKCFLGKINKAVKPSGRKKSPCHVDVVRNNPELEPEIDPTLPMQLPTLPVDPSLPFQQQQPTIQTTIDTIFSKPKVKSAILGACAKVGIIEPRPEQIMSFYQAMHKTGKATAAILPTGSLSHYQEREPFEVSV